nr:hypothetical protein [Tanacetum cinerariifolium]
MGDDVDINTLTMEQYMALIHDNIIPGMVKPKISDDVKFKINSNFMRELRRKVTKNGVVERRNCTLVEAARTMLSAMLSAAKVPLFFWAKAIATQNRDECIFVGYSTQSRAYRVFNKRTRVIMESIHVNFDELPQMASDQLSSDPVPECQNMALNHDSLSPAIQRHKNVPQADRTVTTSNELDLLFSLMFDELLNGSSKVVSKSFAVSAADALNQQTYAENDQVADDEFINTKDHPLEQVIGNPSQSVRTRRQLESNAEMCMFTLTVSRTKPKNIKEAMADSAWIESMQEELHQFDRLDISTLGRLDYWMASSQLSQP